MGTSVMLSIRSMYRLILSKFHLLSPSFVFDSFGLKLSLIVILTNFSHSSNSSKLPARENLQFYSSIYKFNVINNITCLVSLSSKLLI